MTNDQKLMLREIAAAIAEGFEPNEWERGFLKSMSESAGAAVVRQVGTARSPQRGDLSEKQDAALEKIWRKAKGFS